MTAIPPQTMQPTFSGSLAAVWAICGFAALLLQAIVKLGTASVEALGLTLSPMHWLLLVANIAFMAWSEGYKGFQKGFSPRFAQRALLLRDKGSALERILAPLYCMHFFNAPAKRMLISYLLLLLILCFIFVFQLIPQPWRGILDAGVVVGLGWGLVSTVYFSYLALFSPQPQPSVRIADQP